MWRSDQAASVEVTGFGGAGRHHPRRRAFAQRRRQARRRQRSAPPAQAGPRADHDCVLTCSGPSSPAPRGSSRSSAGARNDRGQPFLRDGFWMDLVTYALLQSHFLALVMNPFDRLDRRVDGRVAARAGERLADRRAGRVLRDQPCPLHLLVPPVAAREPVAVAAA